MFKLVHMRWVILTMMLTSCAGEHRFPTYENFNKKCFYGASISWSDCEDKFKAIKDIHNKEIHLWQYKRTF